MSAVAIEMWTFNLREAAVIVGFAEGSLVNLLSRKRPFPEKQGGPGHTLFFTMHNLMTLAVIRALVDFGLTQDDAVRLAPSTAGLYGVLKNDRPEVVRLAVRTVDGRRTGGDARPNEPVAIEVRLWAVWDGFYPKFREVLLSKGSVASREEREAALREYEAHMAEIRARGPAAPTRVWT